MIDEKYVIIGEQIEQFGNYVEDDENHTEEKYKNARNLAASIRSRPLSEHDAEIARKERERVLPLVEKAKATQLSLFRMCWDKNTIELVKQVGMDLRAIEESLRGEQP